MATKSGYAERALRAQDPRFAKILGRIPGYRTRVMEAEEPVAPAPARRAPPPPPPAPAATTPTPEAEAEKPKRASSKVGAVTTKDAAATESKPDAAPNKRKAKAVLDAVGTMSFFEFKAAAGKVLGDDTPAKKADIIAALEAVAKA